MGRMLDRHQYEDLAARDEAYLREQLLSAETTNEDLRAYLLDAKRLIASDGGTAVLRAMSAAYNLSDDIEPDEEVCAAAYTERIVNDWMKVSSVASLFLGRGHETTQLIETARNRYLDLFRHAHVVPKNA